MSARYNNNDKLAAVPPTWHTRQYGSSAMRSTRVRWDSEFLAFDSNERRAPRYDDFIQRYRDRSIKTSSGVSIW